MIRAKEGEIEFDGTLDTLLSEYAVITKYFRLRMAKALESEEDARELLKKACDIGCMSDDEINKELELAKERFEKS